MTDEQTAALMPHAVHLAAAVAHRDPDATAVALTRAGIHPSAAAFAVCLADLVSDDAGAIIRATRRRCETTAETITVLDALGIGAP